MFDERNVSSSSLGIIPNSSTAPLQQCSNEEYHDTNHTKCSVCVKQSIEFQAHFNQLKSKSKKVCMKVSGQE